jgi:hypothetical protein
MSAAFLTQICLEDFSSCDTGAMTVQYTWVIPQTASSILHEVAGWTVREVGFSGRVAIRSGLKPTFGQYIISALDLFTGHYFHEPDPPTPFPPLSNPLITLFVASTPQH